jgi:mono/diheme cytochrome c family protein
MPRLRHLLPWIALLAGVARGQGNWFEDRVAPFLQHRCVRCHGGDATLSGLDLTSAAGLQKGGKHGPVVTPRDPDRSPLFRLVASGKMPQGGEKATPAEVADLRHWITEGAVWTGGHSLKPVRKQFWAFRSPEPRTIPANGARTPVDAFVRAKLAEKGLTPASKADHRTLIRRLHFGLTGLPPQPADYAQRYEDAVERLLASPHYGERWARHWLDVVRFGETDGGEHNYERPHAWPYRDYVIEALNADKPYDQFIREQVAGDLLKPGDPDMAAATGFLVAGPWDQVSVELNKDKVMAAMARMDELDDLVSTTFHTFQALTVNCARCHDHKFDPIPTKDYYRLTALFQGVGFGTRRVAGDEELKRFEARAQPLRDAVRATRTQLANLEDPVRAVLLGPKIRAFAAARRGESRLIPINPLWNRAPVAARHGAFRLVILGHRGERAQIASMVLEPGGTALSNWQSARRATPDDPVMVDLPVKSGAIPKAIEWASDPANGRTDGMPLVFRLEASDERGQWTAVYSNLDHVRDLELDLPTVSEAELTGQMDAGQRAEQARLRAQLQKQQHELDALPAPPRIYCAMPHRMADSFVLNRGSVASPGEKVSPGTLTAISQLPPDLGLTDASPDRERRLALADWLTNPANPLTARVIVNRVWYYHFGNGIVNTPSDFGLNGDRPSHPELLDWLALQFMKNGWSLKWLHRQILLSDTYQQSAAMNARAFETDADNRLLWRMPLRRMDAETIRDAILAVSGKLDLSRRGGPGFLLQKKADRGSFIYRALDVDGPEVWRRAVYRFVVRGGERIMLDSFDCPDPSVATPQRSVSNTPVQALTLLNNEFVLRQAGFLAERLQAHSPQLEQQIRQAYQLLYGREAKDHELKLGQEFVRQQSLALYCRVLLNSNEFVYVP